MARLALLTTPPAALNVRLGARTFGDMLDQYENHLLARNNKRISVRDAIAALRRISLTLGFPWLWETAAWEKFQADRLRNGKALSTRRGDQMVVESFTRYLTDDEYGWPAICQERFGMRPRCLITAANRILHVDGLESEPSVRPFTRDEIQKLFDFVDHQVYERDLSGKGALTAYRDGMFIKNAYAFGVRRSENTQICTFDYHTNIYKPEFEDFGATVVRFGKAKARGPRRRRTVYTTDLMAWIVPELKQYTECIRPLYASSAYDAHMFPTDQNVCMTPEYASMMFRKWCDAANIDPALTLHSLRRSHATHHIEFGYEATFVSEQLGHEWESSTGDYVYLDDDFRLGELLALEAVL